MFENRLAHEVGRAPWKIVLAAIAATATAVVCRPAEQAPSWRCGHEVARQIVAEHAMTYVHVKFRSFDQARLARAGGYEPLFTNLPVNTFDDRARWARLAVPARAAARDAAEIAAQPEVEQAFVQPEVTLANREGPRFDDTITLSLISEDPSCPLKTPSFEARQGYLSPAPYGIDVAAAWEQGTRGAGVWFADIEGGWNAAHEDLPGERIEHVAGTPIDDPSWRAHGTAVLGEVVGRDNTLGVVGIAPEVERVFTASIGGIAVADAIDTAANQLREGDVLLIELQVSGPRGTYIPVEYYDDIFDAIAAASKRGVIVIEAAGNGFENLDHRAYGKKFDRSRRDSGAIMVGAGGPPREGFRDRERLDFSNYGARVDVQGWGRKVATLDYGDLQACDADRRDRDYTNEFSGTSSASPIVAGAAVLLQSRAKRDGRTLTPLEIRDILRRTGTPQAGNTREQIGPRPDLRRALSTLETTP